jgi:dihydroflavonol-4-reductase
MAQTLKSNGYDKISTKLAPNFLIKLLANFNNDLKGLLPYIGNTYNGDISETMKTFNWKPIDLKETVLDTAKSAEEVISK